MKNLLKKVGGITEYLRSRGVVVATGGSALVASPLAFAGGGGSFDTASILAAIAMMVAAGVLICREAGLVVAGLDSEGAVSEPSERLVMAVPHALAEEFFGLVVACGF